MYFDDFEDASNGLWINGKWYPPVHGGQDEDTFGDSSTSVGSSISGGDGGGSEDSGDGGIVFGGGGTQDPFGEPPLLSSEEVLKRGRALALQGLPLQVSNLLATLGTLRARAAGSSAEILPQIIGQLSDLRSQYTGASQAIARRLGFAGGGQVEREQGRALGQATGQYGKLFTGTQSSALSNLLNTLSGLQPTLSGAARPPNISTREAAVDLSQYGTGIANIVNVARQIQDYNASQANRQPAIFANPRPFSESFGSLGYT